MTTQCLLICLLEILPISCASVIEAALISSVSLVPHYDLQ